MTDVDELRRLPKCTSVIPVSEKRSQLLQNCKLSCGLRYVITRNPIVISRRLSKLSVAVSYMEDLPVPSRS